MTCIVPSKQTIGQPISLLGSGPYEDPIGSWSVIATNQTLENSVSKIEGFTYTFKNKMSFNKRIETQFAQITAYVPTMYLGKFLALPETPLENVNDDNKGR